MSGREHFLSASPIANGWGAKMMFTKIVAGVAACFFVCGCSSLPDFGKAPGGTEEYIGPTVEQLQTHIQCEIWKLVEKRGEFEELRKQHYIATVTLTLDVIDVQTFSPSIGVVEPLLRAGTNRVVVLGGQLQGTQHRLINLVSTLDLDPEHKIDSEKTKKCTPGGSGKDGLQGDLGLGEIVLAGLKAKDDVFYLPPVSHDKAGNETPLAIAAPSFATTIDFQILRSIGGGPTWTLTYFRGPAGGANLLNTSKTRKDTLALAFASAGPRGKAKGTSNKEFQIQSLKPDAPAGLSNVEQALKNAQDNLTRMLLQRLLPQ